MRTILPLVLLGASSILAGCETPSGDLTGLEARLPEPTERCTEVISRSALTHGATRVEVTPAGGNLVERGRLEVPLDVRIEYARQGVIRQSGIRCVVDASGQVIALR
jgi:hypothetical protein